MRLITFGIDKRKLKVVKSGQPVPGTIIVQSPINIFGQTSLSMLRVAGLFEENHAEITNKKIISIPFCKTTVVERVGRRFRI